MLAWVCIASGAVIIHETYIIAWNEQEKIRKQAKPKVNGRIVSRKLEYKQLRSRVFVCLIKK